MKNITKKEMLKRVEESFLLKDQKIVDTEWNSIEMILKVIAISEYHTVSRHVWYYDPDVDCIIYLPNVSGMMTVY